MERSNIRSDLILSDASTWQTPHVVQSVRRGGMHWDEFLRVLVQDLAFGKSQDRWIEQLLREGNIGLARELAERINQLSIQDQLEEQDQDWRQMIDVARTEATEYIGQQRDELRSGDLEEYEDLLDVAQLYADEAAYGDAVSALEQALRSVQSLVQRRRAAAAAAFAAAEGRVGKARALYAAVKPSRFPGGVAEQTRARQLLLKADDLLLARDYTNATQYAEWAEAMCNGQDYPTTTVDELLRTATAVEPVSVTVEPFTEEDTILAGPEEKMVFERDWTTEDDEHLVDNYNVMSNGQLNLRFHTTEHEIEQRIKFLGLVHDRNTVKRVRWRNPYVAGKPLKGPRVFVGREDVFSFIEDSLGALNEAEDRNLVVLLGHRRTGKTSILLQLRQNRRELLRPRIPVFIDAEGLLPFPGGLKNFYWKLACCVQEELQDLEQIDLPRPSEERFSVDSAWKFRQFLDEVEHIVGDRGLVFMFDEFQALEPRVSLLDVDFYKMLRSVIQHDSRVDWILSGTMEMERMMRDYQSVLFGSAISKKIDFLDEKDARKLISLPVQSLVTYSQEAMDLIVDVTACHPYFVQLVCWTLMQYLIDRGKSKVSIRDVERILPIALDRGAHFDEIWVTETTELDRYVMAIVGEYTGARKSWCSLSIIEDRLKKERQMPTNLDDLYESILGLTNRRILRRGNDGSTVRFQVDVFGRWVYVNKPFEVVRRDIQAEAARQRRRVERQPMSSVS